MEGQQGLRRSPCGIVRVLRFPFIFPGTPKVHITSRSKQTEKMIDNGLDVYTAKTGFKANGVAYPAGSWPDSRVPTIAYSMPLGIVDFLIVMGALRVAEKLFLHGSSADEDE
jgi:hypothetical protein